MNPLITYWLVFAALTAMVLLLNGKYGMLRDESTRKTKKPYSYARTQLTWWTVIVLSGFTTVILQRQEIPTLTNGILILRDNLALVIVILSIILLLAITVAGIIAIDGNALEKNAAVQSLYGTFLPLMGTWMGAVIAFHFGKENFEAANKSVQTMVQKFITSEDKLKSIILQDVFVTEDGSATKPVIGWITNNKVHELGKV